VEQFVGGEAARSGGPPIYHNLVGFDADCSVGGAGGRGDAGG
jgi:hypothetical protein